MRSQLYEILFCAYFSCMSLVSSNNATYTPIVLWTGMGSSASELKSFEEYLKKDLPEVHIRSLHIGSSATEEIINSFLLHPDEQVKIACDIIRKDSKLKNDFNAIGFSQGSQFLRALVQRCAAAKVKNLISLGGQHQGVYGIPSCPWVLKLTCNSLRILIDNFVYFYMVQSRFVQATYWHDPLYERDYIRYSTFLADINNEKTINQAYIDRLTSLENFVMVKFEKDEMVRPKRSAWFEFYEPGQSSKILPLNESKVYGKLGLDVMDSQKKLHFIAHPKGHLEFGMEWFTENITKKFLMN